MLIVEIDVIDAKPLETGFAGLLDVVRFAIHAADLRIGGIADDAELGR